jgi:hypothetical protein
MSPDIRFTEWTVALVLVVRVPETSVADAVVSMTPVLKKGGALTVAPVFAVFTGGRSVPHVPSVTRKLGPDLKVFATLAADPYASPKCWIPGEEAG